MAGRLKKGEIFEGAGSGDTEKGRQKHLPRPCADATSANAKARAKAPRLILWERARVKAQKIRRIQAQQAAEGHRKAQSAGMSV